MLYDYPQYYDVAFSFRDIKRESAFIQSCIDRFSETPVGRILEIGCGNAPHAEALSEYGYQYVGIDLNERMLRDARVRWRHLSPQPILIKADMVNFDIDTRCDFAFVLLGSLYLNGWDEMGSHFDSLARSLNDGALYFLDWCIQFTDPLEFKDSNAYLIRRNGVSVQSRFDIRLLDADEHLYEETWKVDVNDNGRRHTFETVERNRSILPDEFRSFIDNRSDFQFAGWWRDWDLDKPIHGSVQDIIRPLAIVRKVSSGRY